MSLWAWVAAFPVQPVAIPATPATQTSDKEGLSQQSQLSQGVVGYQAKGEGGQLSQPSQLSQPFGDSEATLNGDAREAFEERAAIMEFDGGMTRAEAERAAATSMQRADAASANSARWPFEEWGDLRPCLLCRNLSPGGRCLAAWRGELRAARDWGPTFPGLPQRCIGYVPKADDPVRATGRERWPEMISWQARVTS